MLGTLGRLSAILAGSHVALTLASVSGASFESHDAIPALPIVGRAGEAGRERIEASRAAAKAVVECYRGQNRIPRIEESFAVDVRLETPLVALQGRKNVVRYFSALKRLKPVQISHKEVYEEERAVTNIMTEFHVFGHAFLVPAQVELVLKDGKVVEHNETWFNRPLVLRLTRELNGIIFSCLFR